jgi:AcrR family transcriptional regulator
VILEAARRVVRRYGPFKTTVADIAKEARVGVGTVYLEFKSKDAILESLSRAQYEAVLGAVERAWGSGRPAKKRLELALTARIEAFLGFADGTHGADLLACACPGVELAYRSFCEAEHAMFSRFLREAAERGEVATREPELDARALLLAYSAFQPPHLFAHPASDLRRDLARVHRLVLEGLVPRARR